MLILIYETTWRHSSKNSKIVTSTNDKEEPEDRKRVWRQNKLHVFRRVIKQVIEGKIKGQTEVTRRRGRRRKKLLDDLGDRRGYSHLKEEALDCIKWRNHFGRGCGPVV
jgi:hypothetical protein